ANRHLRAFRRVIVLARPGRALIEHHRNVASERGLNLHCAFGRNESRTAIDVILKMHARFRNLAQFCERKDLVPATVREDHSVPIHEFMEPTEMFDHFHAGPDKEVVSIAQNGWGVELTQFLWTD